MNRFGLDSSSLGGSGLLKKNFWELLAKQGSYGHVASSSFAASAAWFIPSAFEGAVYLGTHRLQPILVRPKSYACTHSFVKVK
jgi:hypothetical protein